MNNNRIKSSEFKKLIGKWKTEGRILATDNNPEMKIEGMDTYELILGGFFILHRADVVMGNKKSKTFEIMRLDETHQATFKYYNNQGSSGKMKGSLKNNEFRINGKALQFKGQLNDRENQIVGIWEKLEKLDKWKSFLEIKLTRIEYFEQQRKKLAQDGVYN